jgi:nucleoside-diphosphate-sugar epimerase
MKALLIGGTGRISASIAQLAARSGWELYLLNRGRHGEKAPANAKAIIADINDEVDAKSKIKGMKFDAVADFIAFEPEHAQRDIRLFEGFTDQYIYVSATSVYQKPPARYRISEDAPKIGWAADYESPSLGHVVARSGQATNRFWKYSCGKAASEELLMRRFQESGFPVTVVRPAYTYNENSIPLDVHGRQGNWQILGRILQGKPVLMHGDGTSLWTVTWHTDFARAFVGLMGNSGAIGEAVHITSDDPLEWNAIYDLIGDALGKPVTKLHISSDFLAGMRPDLDDSLWGDKAHSVAYDNTKIKRLVPGFSCEVGAAEGMQNCVRHMLAHPEMQITDTEYDLFCDKALHAVESAHELWSGQAGD